jgi:hypothetical protein
VTELASFFDLPDGTYSIQRFQISTNPWNQTGFGWYRTVVIVGDTMYFDGNPQWCGILHRAMGRATIRSLTFDTGRQSSQGYAWGVSNAVFQLSRTDTTVVLDASGCYGVESATAENWYLGLGGPGQGPVMQTKSTTISSPHRRTDRFELVLRRN